MVSENLQPTTTNTLLRDLYERFLKNHPEREGDLGQIRKMWCEDLDMSARSTVPGHFTGTAILLRGDEVLLIEHKRLKKWLFPGGHIDPGEDPLTAAKRELEEDTGLKARPVGLVPFDLDCHPIPENPGKGEPDHFHFDFRYVFQNPEGELTIQLSEVTGAKWVSLKSDLPGDMLRLTGELRRLARDLG